DGLFLDCAAHADVIEMRHQEAPGGAPAGAMQHLEKVEVGLEPARRVEPPAEERNAMQIDLVISGGGLELTPIDQPANQSDRVEFGCERRVESDFVDAMKNIAR